MKAKHKLTLKGTVALVPTRKYLFVPTNVNANQGKRENEVLGDYSGDILNKNDKLLLRIDKGNQSVILNSFLCAAKSGVSYAFQSTNRSKGHLHLSYILINQGGRRLVQCSIDSSVKVSIYFTILP